MLKGKTCESDSFVLLHSLFMGGDKLLPYKNTAHRKRRRDSR